MDVPQAYRLCMIIDGNALPATEEEARYLEFLLSVGARRFPKPRPRNCVGRKDGYYRCGACRTTREAPPRAVRARGRSDASAPSPRARRDSAVAQGAQLRGAVQRVRVGTRPAVWTGEQRLLVDSPVSAPCRG